MFKKIGVAFLVAAATLTAAPAFAFETLVSQIHKNQDGSHTFYFAIKLGPDETLTPGDKASADFMTVYNFYGLIDGSAKSPEGWEFSSEQFGRTPTMNGYPTVMPLDVPNTPNLTWTVTSRSRRAQVDGFTATTRVNTTIQGEYSAQVTRNPSAVQVEASSTPAVTRQSSKQALIGMLPTPSFLAEVN
ncbi:hypothetical protein [Lichenifustis flavocetrariae]|uniref:Uncharacterized protein n=1 Tax=Lichenifustis flavocetrariae TaxID=2949735 RepID=A0AA41Z3A0_9HYPH|nr:hypothetical protein [Lichenifustis flavocetrariae]MCW6512206.1 hypothetical protein [Lichenifustis flavocetrariae]